MKKQILFLAANPAGTAALKLDEEARAIQEEIQRASQRHQFEFVTRMAARPLDLLRALRDVKPTIVHFAGHAGADGIYATGENALPAHGHRDILLPAIGDAGIYLIGENGLPACVTRDTLLATFGAAGQSVQLVVLNACSTEDLAEALCEFVPICVGTSATIRDDAARMFSIGFYGALASKESAARACLHGNAAMRLSATSHHDRPHLHHRRDVDPNTLVLADDKGAISSTPTTSRSPAVHAMSQLPIAVAAVNTVTAPTTGSFTRGAGGTDLIAPLILLQLSDLHFGPHSRFAGSDLERVAARCRQALDEMRGDLGWREAVSLVLVTGDIAEAARPPEYAIAAMFFRALAQQLALPSHRFVFVPGNHDISWTKCREVEGQLEDGAFPASELRARLDEVKLAHFEKFIRDVHGGKARHEIEGAAVTSLAHGAFIHDFADLGISVAALNSCERESHRKEDHVGALSPAQAQAVLDHWHTSATSLIRLVAVHHNPALMASVAVKQWLEFLRSPTAQLTADLVERIATNFVGFEGHEYLRNVASDAHTSLILHGHHHASAAHQAWAWRGRGPGGTGDARILSAGSWGLSPESGKLPKDQPVVMQLIRLDPAAAQLHAVLLTYDPSGHLSGEAHPGRFHLDAQTRAERPIGLSLPPALRDRFRSESVRDRDRAPEVVADPQPGPRASEVAAVIANYRARKSGSFERWDLRTAGPVPTTGNRPAEITLDEMYIPLRFAAELDPSKFDRGAPITLDDLLGVPITPDNLPRGRQVVIGNAGSGKTTWMRWMFRRLIRDPRAVPFFLELRMIAAAWKTAQDTVRTIDRYLAGELTECGTSDPGAIVAALLVAESGPQPVILIDGWDELGGQGERLRERLVEFCSAFPRVIVMVSSRPYGETRPAGAEAFQTLYVQPLSDHDVRLLATNFHRRVHGLDESAGTRATDEFMSALTAAPDARSLASIALLLTMMLLLSREGPLPDRRHKLYAACLRNMLLHRVTQRERDGAVVDLDQWRPDDSEERLRVVAELAYRMQTEGYKAMHRAPIIRPWDEAVKLLKAEWMWGQRDRFLRWLVASAGVLVDRSDGSVHFAHLSFQEYLAAYYLFITREGDERVAAVRAHMGDRDWWETLRLWAGLIGDHWPDKLSPVLAKLRTNTEGYWLAGEIFADGTGTESEFETWAAELAARLSDPFGMGDDCARAWGTSKQSDRRAALAARLASVQWDIHWLENTWHADWCHLANIEIDPAPALLILETPTDSANGVAQSRVLLGAAASWPDRGELAVLRLWPSIRVPIGVRLQVATSLRAQAPEVVTMLPALLARATRSWSDDDYALAEDFCGDFARFFAREFSRYFKRDFKRKVGRDFGRSFGRDFGRELGRYFARDFGRGFARNFGRDFGRKFGRELVNRFGRRFAREFIKEFGQDFSQDLSQNFSQDFGRELKQLWARELGRVVGWNFRKNSVREFIQEFCQDLVQNSRRYFGQELKQDYVRYFGRDFGFSELMLGERWLAAFALLESGSVVERATPRAALAYGNVPVAVPLFALFRVACQASFAPDDTSLLATVARHCDDFDGDPLWPALARHVARISTAEDRALLEGLARHPEQREPPLSWGLQFYVRGDLVFNDDAVVTLDELCAQAGLAPLPLLESMPDELEIPLDEASP